MKTAILIPCYNEEMTIEKVVLDFKKVMPHADIYVYDNNSTDNSYEIAKNTGAIVKREFKQGKGNVVREEKEIYITEEEYNNLYKKKETSARLHEATPA